MTKSKVKPYKCPGGWGGGDLPLVGYESLWKHMPKTIKQTKQIMKRYRIKF
jgi:hypothetical protein